MSVRNLRLVDRQRECDLAGDPHFAKRPYARAMRACVEHVTGAVADSTGLSQRAVESWANPADPQRGPNFTLALAMRAALNAGKAEEEALAPLHDLAKEFGFSLAPRLPVVSSDQLLRQADRLAATSLQSLGEAVSGLLERALDGRLSVAEREATRAELRRHLQSVYSLLDLNENAGRG